MKRIVKIPLFAILIMCTLFTNTIIAGNRTSYTVSMQKQSKRQSEHNKELDDEGRRTPPKPIYCVISKTEGLNIIGLPEEIMNYEILDPSSEINLASFSEESDFINFLFYQIGNFKLNFETENYNICGYITID